MVKINGKVIIIGDIHGQFFDMIAMLKKLSKPGHKHTRLLFLGDYVDRGEYGPEVVIYLMALKLEFPNHVYLLRGNHESRDMTQMFNFRDQVLDTYDEETYDVFMDLFDNLPIASLVNGQHFCMHGGISERLTSINSVNSIDRFKEVDDESLLADLMWADPAHAKKCHVKYAFNSDRQISVIFGKRPVNDFLKKEGLKSIIRAHQLKQRGYKFHSWNGEEEFPPVITVFSAPNYSGSNNEAAVLISEADNVDLRTFSEKKDKPFILQDRADAFSFFQPKLQSMVLEIMYQVLSVAQTAKSTVAGRALSISDSTDANYLKKIIV